MDTMAAYAKALAHKNDTPRVFDWDRAAQIIKERGATEAAAGLSGDWEWTGGEILADGKPVPEDDTYTYLCSVWATPELEIDGEIIDCWRYVPDTPDWDAKTYWPESALEILNS